MFGKIIILCIFFVIVQTFPDGAPADTCVKKRVNQPHHGAARSQPSSSLPYRIVASSDTYHPGQQIQGKNTVWTIFDKYIELYLFFFSSILNSSSVWTHL